MATKSGPKLDEDELREAIQPHLAEVAETLTSALHDVAREVRDEMGGRPTDEIGAELRRRIETAIPGVELDESKLRVVAEEISAGRLVG
jgi:hypothetical protein